MTAGVLTSEREQYSEAGMDGFVAKPIDHEELYREMKVWLHRAENTVAEFNQESTVVDASGTTVELALNLQKVAANNSNEQVSDLDILSIERLNNLTRGRAPRVARLCQSLQSAIENGDVILGEAALAVEQGDYSQAKFALHSLKGLAGNYGADRLHGHIQNVESRLIANDFDNIGAEVQVLKVEMAEFIVLANAWINENKSA